MELEKLNGLQDERPDAAEQKPTKFFVLSGGRGEWLIYREGIMNPIGSQPGKLRAIESAKVLARLEASSEVLVEQRNGTFKVQYASPAPAGLLQP